jgi:hypothetical protein
MYAYIHMYIHGSFHPSIHACNAYMRKKHLFYYVCMSGRARLHSMYACMHVCICAYVHIRIGDSKFDKILALVRLYIIYIYIYIYICMYVYARYVNV